MAEQELQRELGIRGVVFRTARGECVTVASEGRRLDRVENEEVVLEQGGDDGALAELQTDGDGGTGEALAKLFSPGAESRGPVLDGEVLALSRPGTERHTSCFLSAQSMPMNAAN